MDETRRPRLGEGYWACEKEGEDEGLVAEVTILGTKYEIIWSNEDMEPRLKDCDGFTDWTTHKIFVLEASSASGTLESMETYLKKVLRHEIVHAFFLESGLHECSGESDAWAANETMVDWIARQGEKIYHAWMEADAV